MTKQQFASLTPTQLRQEATAREETERALESRYNAFFGATGGGSVASPAVGTTTTTRATPKQHAKRKVSAAQRAKLSAAMKARWQARKAGGNK